MVRCTDRANQLLLFYLNGTLSGPEETAVREHVDLCDACSRELEVLSGVAQAVRRGSLQEPVEGWWTAWTASAAVAAAVILLSTSAGILLLRERPERAAPSADPSVALPDAPVPEAAAGDGGPAPEGRGLLSLGALLDLHGGPLRNGTGVPLLSLDPRVEIVSIRFRAPMAAARRRLEIRDPAGGLLIGEDLSLVLDPLGTATFAVPASLFVEPGLYELALRQEHGSPEERLFRYPFRVNRVEPKDAPDR